MNPIERLFERDGLPRFGLPAALATSYGGDFGLSRPALYANFVSSADGVVALPCCPEIHRRGSRSLPMVIVQHSVEARPTGHLAICPIVIRRTDVPDVLATKTPNRAEWAQGFQAEEIAGA